jgi:hypothetical protein
MCIGMRKSADPSVLLCEKRTNERLLLLLMNIYNALRGYILAFDFI